MQFPHQNPLPKPEIITTPNFEDLLLGVKAQVLDYLAQNAPDDVDAVRETFDNESELLTKFTEAFTVILQGVFRQFNAQSQQMFGMYATDDDMVDVIVSQLGVTRQILDAGDPDAYPPIDPTMESNDALLTRYYLAAYALATTGTRAGYRFNAMTLGGRPKVVVESPSESVVVVTYEFSSNEQGGKAKDAKARQSAPGSVDCFILSHDGNGLPSDELVSATQSYMDRDDIAQETDLLTVKKPTIIGWSCTATVYISAGRDSLAVKAAAEKAVLNYGDDQHRLEGSIELSKVYSVLTESAGAHRVDIEQPAQSLRCQFNEAPYLESVTITVISENV